MGARRPIFSSVSSSPAKPRSIGVRTLPGSTALTRMPCRATSRAADLVSPMTPCFDAE